MVNNGTDELLDGVSFCRWAKADTLKHKFVMLVHAFLYLTKLRTTEEAAVGEQIA